MTSPAVAPPVTHTIAEAAARTGVTAHTLRYYERIGLLDVARDPNGRRRYDATAADLVSGPRSEGNLGWINRDTPAVSQS